MLSHPIEKLSGVIICVPNPFRRKSLARLFEASDFQSICCADPIDAVYTFRLRCMEIRVLVFDLDAIGLDFLDSITQISEAVGYCYKPYIVALSECCNDSDLESELIIRGAELRSIERPLEIVHTAEAIRLSFSKTPFRLIHYCDHDFEGRCVPGEVPALEIRPSTLGVPLTETPLYFADAILKYSPHAHRSRFPPYCNSWQWIRSI
jgi:hypothetical protein